MICGRVSGTSGLAIAIFAIAGLLALSCTMLRTPKAFVSFSHRYDAWLSSKARAVKLILWPGHWLESRLERFDVAPAVVRAWGVVFGLIGLCLLGLLVISVVNPCA